VGVGMSLSLSETLQEVQDVASTLVRATPTGLTSGETMFNPASWHGHQGGNDMFILTDPGLDFQLFRSANDLTFITGDGDTASYWGGGNQTIYNSGTDTTLRFSELEDFKVNVYGLDATSHVDFYNATNTAITSDGQGGTLIDGVDFFGVNLAASQVSFLHSSTPLSQNIGLVPLS
jgi:triacylglycerol esterase/lipase EstA (alpha/beta hydrolase family)